MGARPGARAAGRPPSPTRFARAARRARRCAAATLAAAAFLGPASTVAAAQAPPRRTVTLEEAIRLSLANDPAAVAAEAAVATAAAGLLQARGSWLPSLTVASGFSNSSNQRFDQATGRLVSESYTAQTVGSLELFSGGRRLAENRAASASVAAAEARHRAQRFQTILTTTQIFYEAAAATELVRSAEQRMDRALQQLDFARTRFELGTATTSDVLRAELEVGNAELAALDAQSALRTTALALGRRAGVAHPVHPASSALPERAPALPPTDVLVERAARAAPAVLAADAMLKSRHADKLANYTPYLPSIRMSGGYDWFAFEFPPTQRSWSLRLFASLPIFNGFQREAAVRRAAAAERVAAARARDAAVAVRVQVESAVHEIASSEQRVEISRRAVELAREDLRVQEERYQIGAATILELQASQVALAEAEVAAVRARQSLGTAVARLEAILGERIGGEERE